MIIGQPERATQDRVVALFRGLGGHNTLLGLGINDRLPVEATQYRGSGDTNRSACSCPTPLPSPKPRRRRSL